MAVRGTGEPETLSYEVDLNKDSALGLGITVAGYVCEQGWFVCSSIFVQVAKHTELRSGSQLGRGFGPRHYRRWIRL